jgi:hypothetical protein
MRVRDLRFLTAIVIVGMSAFAISQGLNIVRFRLTQWAGGDVRWWTEVTGLASSAREKSLNRAVMPGDEEGALKQRDKLIQLLSIQPMASVHWLSLSAMDVVAGQSPTQIAGALVLSALTGPNEGQLMIQRGIFGLSIWETLPPEVRATAVIDLTGGLLQNVARLTEADKASLRVVLSRKTDKVRLEIAAALQARGFTAEDTVYIGL